MASSFRDRILSTISGAASSRSSSAGASATSKTSSSPSAALTHVTRSESLFPKTNASVDGDECLRDCAGCSVKYPRGFSINERDELYGNVKEWEAHLIVATGKTDWVRDVADEKGSIMEAVDRASNVPSKLKISASDMPVPESESGDPLLNEVSTTVLMLPAFIFADNVTPGNTSSLISVMRSGPTNTSRLSKQMRIPTSSVSASSPSPSSISLRDCPHDYLILLCSQRSRDARCGQSAPLLRKEFERHLRPRGLHRDLHDERPGGVGIYFISHVGGHKYSANVLIYRRAGTPGAEAPVDGRVTTAGGEELGGDAVEEQDTGEGPSRQAGQCIWLARVKPEDCENIVRYTILQGKVVKPETQLRGGFDRCRGLASW